MGGRGCGPAESEGVAGVEEVGYCGDYERGEFLCVSIFFFFVFLWF